MHNVTAPEVNVTVPVASAASPESDNVTADPNGVEDGVAAAANDGVPATVTSKEVVSDDPA